MSSFFGIYLACVGGVLISVILPILRRSLPDSTGDGSTASGKSQLQRAWKLAIQVATPYILWGLISALTALLIVAFLGEQLTDWRAALVAGYAWDATIQRIGVPVTP